MEKFEKFSGIAAPMPLVNIDTDMIIPKQFLKTIKRSGLGVNAFAEMRYKSDGSEGHWYSNQLYRCDQWYILASCSSDLFSSSKAGALRFVSSSICLYCSS